MFEKLPINDKLIHKSVIYEVPISMIISERSFMREYDTVNVVKLATSIRRIGLIEPIILRYPCATLPDDPEDLFKERNDLVNYSDETEKNCAETTEEKKNFSQRIADMAKSTAKIFDRSKDSRKYLLISGGYRLRACKMLGMETIPARFALYSEKCERSLPVVGDFFGNCSDMFERSKKYVKACVDLGMNACELAENLGFQQKTALSLFNMAKLSDNEADLAAMHKLSFESVAQIARLPYPAARLALIHELCSGGVCEKDLPRLVTDVISGKNKNFRQSKRLYCKDLRIYMNTIKKTVGSMTDNGFDSTIHISESDEVCKIVIEIREKSTSNTDFSTESVEKSVEKVENSGKIESISQNLENSDDNEGKPSISVEKSVETVETSENIKTFPQADTVTA